MNVCQTTNRARLSVNLFTMQHESVVAVIAAERGGDEMLHRPRHGTPAFMAPEMSSSHRRYRHVALVGHGTRFQCCAHDDAGSALCCCHSGSQFLRTVHLR